MARLPSEQYLMQQIGGQVILFEDFTEREIVRFDPGDPADTARARALIRAAVELSPEDKSFAHFWAGYFASYAGHPDTKASTPVTFDPATPAVGVFGESNHIALVEFDPRDANAAARAQKAIHDSELTDEDKALAHFWCGFFYGLAGGSRG